MVEGGRGEGRSERGELDRGEEGGRRYRKGGRERGERGEVN